MKPIICPDCRGGKHTACIGRAWDEQAEAEVMCECPCHWDTLTSTPDSWGAKTGDAA